MCIYMYISNSMRFMDLVRAIWKVQEFDGDCRVAICLTIVYTAYIMY